MNRLQLWADAVEEPSYSAIEVESGEVASVRPPTVNHSLFVPLHYEKNYAYPLLIWLHGPADNEHQLRQVMPLVSMRNYVAIAPRGASPSEPRNPQAGYCWRQTGGDILAAEQSVFECMEVARGRLNINPARIFLGGYLCGGTMALRVAMMHPELFGGALSIGGPFPTGHMPLRQVDHARRMPLMLAQGRDSQAYAESRLCDDLRLLHSAGMSVNVRQYPCEDELTTQMLTDVDAWMMEQVTGMRSAPVEPSQPNYHDAN